MANVRIETAATKDVIECVTAPADRRFFLDRLRRGPDSGRAYLAFTGPDPVGCVYLRLEEADEPELRALLPDVPLIQRLRVLDPYQRQGIGSELVAAAEEGAREQSRNRIALGVDVGDREETDLTTFYLKAGYREWASGLVDTFEEEERDGAWVLKPGRCRIFLKSLRSP